MFQRDFKYFKLDSMLEKMCEKTKSLSGFYDTPVLEIMQTVNPTLSCVNETTNVETVLQLLLQTDHVWVVDSTQPNQLLGVITLSDAIALLSPPLLSSLDAFEKPDDRSLQFGETLPITEIMSQKPVTVSAEETVKDVLVKMKEQKIKQLPVVDEAQCLIGEVCLTRLIQGYLKQQSELAEQNA